MSQRIPEGLGGLARQGTAGGVGDRARDHHRQAAAQILEHPFDREHRGLGVQRVEDGLDQQQVGAPCDQAAGGDRIVVDQRIEVDVAKTGVVDIRRDRQGARGRTEHAGTEARLAGIRCSEFVAQFADDARTLDVDLIGQLAQTVLRLGHPRRVEGTGLDDVGAGLEVRAMDAGHRVRAGQHQQVVVALQVARMVRQTAAAVVGLGQLQLLDHRAHRAIQDQDAFGEQAPQFVASISLHVRFSSFARSAPGAPTTKTARQTGWGLRAPLFDC